MIPQEEAEGLLCEADHAQATGANGGMVLLTPEYTRYIVGLLRQPSRVEAVLTVWEESKFPYMVEEMHQLIAEIRQALRSVPESVQGAG